MLELSKAVQRVIDVERNANEDLRKELATLKAAAAAKTAQPTREVRHAQRLYLCHAAHSFLHFNPSVQSCMSCSASLLEIC